MSRGLREMNPGALLACRGDGACGYAAIAYLQQRTLHAQLACARVTHVIWQRETCAWSWHTTLGVLQVKSRACTDSNGREHGWVNVRACISQYRGVRYLGVLGKMRESSSSTLHVHAHVHVHSDQPCDSMTAIPLTALLPLMAQG